MKPATTHICKRGITEPHDDCYVNLYGRLVICHFEDITPLSPETILERLK